MEKRLLLFLISLLYISACSLESSRSEAKPRVFIFTDINIDQGDPDDRQSLIHLLWYANEVKIEGIVPDRWEAQGYEACELAVAAYENDYEQFTFSEKGYPQPDSIKKLIAKNMEDAQSLFKAAASKSEEALYVLVWGNMESFRDVLLPAPELAKNLRVISIGTGLMLEKDNPHLPASWYKADQSCKQANWNGAGRNDIYQDQRFNEMWWLEINWTYNGMFTGDGPTDIFKELIKYGSLGKHMQEVVKNQKWAQYFRVGDTPSLLYVIDPNHDLNNATVASWAGKFERPFPETKPNYFTDKQGPVEWDYQDPCNTWDNHVQLYEYARATLETERPEMYRALIKKLESIY